MYYDVTSLKQLERLCLSVSFIFIWISHSWSYSFKMFIFLFCTLFIYYPGWIYDVSKCIVSNTTWLETTVSNPWFTKIQKRVSKIYSPCLFCHLQSAHMQYVLYFDAYKAFSKSLTYFSKLVRFHTID